MNFKKTTLLFILLSTTLFSQEKISIGINTGLTYSNFRGNVFFDNYEYGFDFLIGVSFDHKINEKLFISTDLNYERKSANFFYDASSIAGEGGTIMVIGTPIGEIPKEKPKTKFQTRFEYITLPIMLKYFVGSNNNFYINAGPYLSYLMNIKNIDDGKESDLDFKNDLKKTDLGITFGFGYIFKVNDQNHLSIEIRNNLGLASINKYENSPLKDTKANAVNFILSWNFRI